MSAPATARKTATSYHVLKQTNASGATPTFQLVGLDLTAASGEAAVRAYAERAAKAGNDEQQATSELAQGTYVAVPARSWKPVKVAVETKTSITFT